MQQFQLFRLFRKRWGRRTKCQKIGLRAFVAKSEMSPSTRFIRKVFAGKILLFILKKLTKILLSWSQRAKSGGLNIYYKIFGPGYIAEYIAQAWIYICMRCMGLNILPNIRCTDMDILPNIYEMHWPG